MKSNRPLKEGAAGEAMPAESPSQVPTAATLPDAAVHAPAPQPAEWPRDQYTGLGGQYVRDPVTGVRRPASDPT